MWSLFGDDARMSNPLEKPISPSNPPSLSIDPDEMIEEMDKEEIRETEKWINDLLKDERMQERYKQTRPEPKVSVHQLEEKRQELFKAGSKFAPVTRTEIVGIDNVLAQIDEVVDWLIYY